MRIAILIVVAFVMPASVHASMSCMSKVEARGQFGNVHLYWHGPDHCWDATAGYRHTAKAQPHEHEHEHRPKAHEIQQPKWREANSEMLDTEPAPQPGTTTEQPAPPPIEIARVRLASIMADRSERWIDVPQMSPEHLTKVPSAPVTTPAPEKKIEPTSVIRVLALILFSTGLVLTFVALVVRSGTISTGLNPMDRAADPSLGFATGADEPWPQTGHEAKTKIQNWIGALPTPLAARNHQLQTVKYLIFVLIARLASSACWQAVRWARHFDGFVSVIAYPTEVKWPPSSAGAMMSREGVSRPLTVPSRLFEEARETTSRANSLPKAPTPRIRTTASESDARVAAQLRPHSLRSAIDPVRSEPVALSR